MEMEKKGPFLRIQVEISKLFLAQLRKHCSESDPSKSALSLGAVPKDTQIGRSCNIKVEGKELSIALQNYVIDWICGREGILKIQQWRNLNFLPRGSSCTVSANYGYPGEILGCAFVQQTPAGTLRTYKWACIGGMPRDGDLALRSHSIGTALWGGVPEPPLPAPWSQGATTHGGASWCSSQEITPTKPFMEEADWAGWGWGGVGCDQANSCVSGSEMWFCFAELFCLWVTETQFKLG